MGRCSFSTLFGVPSLRPVERAASTPAAYSARHSHRWTPRVRDRTTDSAREVKVLNSLSFLNGSLNPIHLVREYPLRHLLRFIRVIPRYRSDSNRSAKREG